MTCIIGFVDKGKVYIGGDSVASNGYLKLLRTDKKVFHNGPMIFGFTTSFRMGQLLEHKLKIPKQTEKQSDYCYLCTTFIDAVVECLTESQFAEVDNNVAKGGTFLLGYRGRLYRIDADFQVGESVNGYDAIGSGENLALGALSALEDYIISPEGRIEKALKAAEKFSTTVSGPFNIIKEQ